MTRHHRKRKETKRGKANQKKFASKNGTHMDRRDEQTTTTSKE